MWPQGACQGFCVTRRKQGGLLGARSPGGPRPSRSLAFQLLLYCQETSGARLFNTLMKMTFYGQFVAGEDRSPSGP